jgi:hypothetical protein
MRPVTPSFCGCEATLKPWFQTTVFLKICSKPTIAQKTRLSPELRKYYLVWGRMTQISRKIFQNSLLPLHIDTRANGMGYCMPTCGLSSLLMIELQTLLVRPREASRLGGFSGRTKRATHPL